MWPMTHSVGSCKQASPFTRALPSPSRKHLYHLKEQQTLIFGNASGFNSHLPQAVGAAFRAVPFLRPRFHLAAVLTSSKYAWALHQQPDVAGNAVCVLTVQLMIKLKEMIKWTILKEMPRPVEHTGQMVASNPSGFGRI